MTTLTPREREVAALLGRTNAEIADTLCISVLTASDHVKAIMRKSETTTRTAAALMFQREGDRRDRLTLLIDLIGVCP